MNPRAVERAKRPLMADAVTPGSRVHDLLRPEVLAAFDRTAFERDGYWVWEGVLSDAGRKRWTASLQKLQRMNDSIITDTDWAAIDFAGRGSPGWRSVTFSPTASTIPAMSVPRTGVGGCQSPKRSRRTYGTPATVTQSGVFTLVARTRIRTSSAPTDGLSSSSSLPPHAAIPCSCRYPKMGSFRNTGSGSVL